jgi:hypothetical protein
LGAEYTRRHTGKFSFENVTKRGGQFSVEVGVFDPIPEVF